MVTLWNFTTQIVGLVPRDTVAICGGPVIVNAGVLTVTRLGTAVQLVMSSRALAAVMWRLNMSTPAGTSTSYNGVISRQCGAAVVEQPSAHVVALMTSPLLQLIS